MLKLTNLEISCTEYSDFSVSCHFDGARYHIWLDRDTCKPNLANRLEPHLGQYVPIHKNSIPKQGEPGYFPHKELKSTSKFGQQLVKQLVEFATPERIDTAILEAKREAEEHRKKITEEYCSNQRVNILKFYQDHTPYEAAGDIDIAKRILRHACDYLYVEYSLSHQYANGSIVKFGSEAAVLHDSIHLMKERIGELHIQHLLGEFRHD